MRNRTWLFTLISLLAFSGTSAAQTPASIPTNSVTDPVGDARTYNDLYPSAIPGPDLIAASLTGVAGGGIKFIVRFAAGTYDPQVSEATFNLDTDQNPDTGFQGVDSNHTDSAIMGTDYIIMMRPGRCSTEGEEAQVLKWNGTWWDYVAGYPMTQSSAGDDVVLEATVPAVDLGSPTAINFDVLSDAVLLFFDPDNVCVYYSGVLDYMPDPGSISVSPIVLPLNPNGSTNVYQFFNNLFNYKVKYPAFNASGLNLSVQPILLSQTDLDARVDGTGFAGAQLVPYGGTGGAGVLFRATCEDSDHIPVTCPDLGTDYYYDVATNWEPTGQPIVAPAFLKADVGANNWQDILTAFYEERIDPGVGGRTCCKFSDFVVVDFDPETSIKGTRLPEITINSPADGTAYFLHQTVQANYSCGNADTCEGTVPTGSAIDTSSVGPKAFEVKASVSSASSINGTVSYTKSVSYSVASDKICLLYDPARSVKKGATYPIKLQICDDAGRNLSAPTIVLNAFKVNKIDPLPDGALMDVNDSGKANPDNNFRFDASLGGGGYIYNLSTKLLSGAGTFDVLFKVAGDPATRSARFNVKY